MTISTIMLIPGLALALVGQPARVQLTTAGPTVQDSTYAILTSTGEVTLELEPRWAAGVLAFEVKANTHSIDLTSVNLAEQVVLIVADSQILPADAGSLSGHHASATVVFRLDRRPGSFTLEIRDVPDVEMRRLTWPL